MTRTEAVKRFLSAPREGTSREPGRAVEPGREIGRRPRVVRERHPGARREAKAPSRAPGVGPPHGIVRLLRRDP